MAPVAVNVAVCPAQIAGELTVTVGVAFTVTVAVFIAEQVPFDPVTVYTVVEGGETLVVDVFAPVLHV